MLARKYGLDYCGLTRAPLGLVAQEAITFAGAPFEALAINDLGRAMAIFDAAVTSKLPHRHRYPGSANAQQDRQGFMADRQGSAVGSIVGHE